MPPTSAGAGKGGEPPDPAVQGPAPTRPSKQVLLAAAAIIAVGLIVAALILRSGPVADEEVAAGEEATTTSSTAPGAPSTTTGMSTTTVAPTTVPPGPPITQAELDAAVAELAQFVEMARQLRFKELPTAELLDPATFDERVQAMVSDEELQDQGELLSQLGLLPPGADPVAEFRAELSARVAGYYDAENKTLAVKNTQLTLDSRQVLVHELVHALDDQHFDLYRPEYAELPDETAFGFRAVTEGIAVLVEREWRDRYNPTSEWPLDDLPDLSETDPHQDYETVVEGMLAAPYVYGERSVYRMFEMGGWPRVHGALVKPPPTSEQILHFDRLLVDEQRIEVEPPPADGEVTDEGVLGELMLEAMLEVRIGREMSVRAASGWGGDWYVRYTDPEGLTCLRIDWVMDSSGDFRELVEAFDSWQNAGGIAEIELVEEGKLRYTNCVPPAGGGGGESSL